METVRLRKINSPPHVERLIEAFASRGDLCPRLLQIRASRRCKHATMVWNGDQKRSWWACWADSYHPAIHLRDVAPLSRERGLHRAQVESMTKTGELKDAVSWVNPQGKWSVASPELPSPPRPPQFADHRQHTRPFGAADRCPPPEESRPPLND